jgi:hypothetical protein
MTFDQWWKHIFGDKKIPDWIHETVVRHAYEAAAKAEKREWVGLTDEEIKEIVGPWGETPIKGYTRKLFDAIEAKLREKNHG